MADIVQIMDSYTETVLPKLMEQYKEGNAPKLCAFLKASGAQKDDLESAIFQVRSGFYISSAVGVQLDRLGELFNVPRGSMNDDEYRWALRKRAALRSFATPEDIISVLVGIYDATNVYYVPEYPAKFWVYAADLEGLTQLALDAISPAGVQAMQGALLCDVFQGSIITATGAPILVVART